MRGPIFDFNVGRLTPPVLLDDAIGFVVRGNIFVVGWFLSEVGAVDTLKSFGPNIENHPMSAAMGLVVENLVPEVEEI